MTAAPQLRFTFREYLRVDAESSVKHEFLDGMILAMVAHDERRIDVFSRNEGSWNLRTARAGERVALDGVGCVLDVDDVYRDPLSE